MENFSLPNSELKHELGHRMSKLHKKIIFRLAVVFGILILFNFLFFSAPKNFPAEKIIKIEQGSSLRNISKDLKENQIIRSRIAFEAFAIIFGGEKHMVTGDYLFENKQPVFKIAMRILKGEFYLAPVKVTIPEGFDVGQIADTFSSKLANFDKDRFLSEAKIKEGYLFPDTYFFFTTANERDVLKYMSDNFEKKIASVESEIISSARTEKEIIIMASIIEREAKGDADRAIISGILWNRISKKIPLQVDAVPETYKTKGLPENPVCNPGLEAIESAINPVNSSYLYYLHDKEGLIHYAKTFTEHNKNITKYLR